MKTNLEVVRKSLEKSGPVGVISVIFLLGLAWLSLARSAFVALYWSRLADVPESWRMFLNGLRMDVIVLCQLMAVPIAIYFLAPGRILRERVSAGLFALFGALIVNMELTTPNFIAEFDNRPDRIYYEYFKYPDEVLTTLVKTYPIQLVIVALLVAASGFGVWRLIRLQQRTSESWTWSRRALFFPLLAALLFIGARSSFDHRPANLSTAAFSNNHLANELAANSTYTLLSAIYYTQKEVDAAKLYGSMEWNEVLARVRSYTGHPATAFPSAEFPTAHRQPVRAAEPQKNTRPPNLVIFVLESFGADFVGQLGGVPLSPNLDKWSSEGLWFTDLYATGTRTVRGLEAIATGFPPTAAPSVLKLPNAQRNFFTLAELLKTKGYATDFIYGGVSNFDNMGKFFIENGFARVIDQKDFANPVFLGTWGVSDEDLVQKAHETLLSYGEQPFFALLLSTSNHVPFEFPAGRIEPHEQLAGTRDGGVKYTDYAIGKLFQLARSSSYWENTVFLIVADHDARVYGADLVPVRHFHIPGLIVGPGVPKRHFTQVASQIDLAPTLLGILGLESEHPMIGRDLLALPADTPGRAIMQYGDANGFRVGDSVVVHQPHLPAQTFDYRDKRLIPTAHNAELEKDALAHLLWADRTYRERRYRLPETTAAPSTHR